MRSIPHPLLLFTAKVLDVLGENTYVPAEELHELARMLPEWARPIVELQAWQRGSAGLDKAELARLGQQVESLFGEAHAHPELAQVAAIGGAALVRAAALAGFESEPIARELSAALDRLEGIGAAHAAYTRLCRYLLLEGVYDARVTEIDHEVLLETGPREERAKALLDFIDGQMEPARRARAAEIARQPQGADRDRELARIELAQEHRRLSWSTAVLAEKAGWHADQPSQWIALAQKYEELGHRGDALGAVSNGLERLVEHAEQSDRRAEQSAVAIKQLLEKLPDGALQESLSPDACAEVRKVLVRAMLLVDDRDRARATLLLAKDALRSRLAAATDEFSRSYLLRDADDWLGLAGCVDTDGSTLAELHSTYRSASLPELASSDNDEVVVYPVLGRQRAFLLIGGERVELVPVAKAHEIGLTLNVLHRVAHDDVADGGTASNEARWRDLLQKLAGRVGARAIQEKVRGKHVLVLVAGTAVHVPWPAALFMANCGVRSVRMRVLGFQPADRWYSIEGSVYRNCFPPGEQWYDALRILACSVGAAEHGGGGENAHSGLSLVGAHGKRTFLGELLIQVAPNQFVPAKEFVRSMPLAKTVLCAICYAGGGFLSGAGNWDSLPALALERGAARVLANIWPAWDPPSGHQPFIDLLKAVRSAADSREAAAALLGWQQNGSGQHPRWWSGWGLWDSGG